MAPIQRQSGDFRRKQIKNAALEIIFNDGLKKLSTHNLAQKVGLSDGAIFRHFHSKMDIIYGVIEDMKEELVVPLEQIAYGKNAPPKRLKEYICFHIQYLKQKKGITMLLFTEASFQNNQILKSDLDEVFHLQEKYFSHIISDGINQGLWDNTVSVESLSTLYMGIPIVLNIEINLHANHFAYHNFCEQMLILIRKILNGNTFTMANTMTHSPE